MRELIEYIARSLVDDPTQVEVEERKFGGTTRVELGVAKEDMGRVIGRRGRVANAMRLLMRVAANRSGNRRAQLEIIDPE